MLPILLSFLRAARIRRRPHPPLLLLLLTLLAAPAHAQTAAPPDKPILRIETGMHTAQINSISVDAANRYLATASYDKTVRVWDAATGSLIQTLRPPIGDGNEGKIYAVAISPDGRTVACGGWTSSTGLVESLYLFDRATGTLRRRLTGLPTSVNHLVYSPDGSFLVACLGSGGIRLFRTRDYALIAKDTDYGYGAASYGADFSPDSSHLATTCYDGYIRLYVVSNSVNPSLRLLAKTQVAGGSEPRSVSISPDGQEIAVGFTNLVSVLSGRDLKPLFQPDLLGRDNPNLMSVCWSTDGHVLYAGGGYKKNLATPILRWSGDGRGSSTDLIGSSFGIMSLKARSTGGIFFGAGDPAFGLVSDDGRRVFCQPTTTADLRNFSDESAFHVSGDGTRVRFDYQSFGEAPASFSINNRMLLPGAADAGLTAPITAAVGLDIQGWFALKSSPTLNGKALTLSPNENSMSLAIAPDSQNFLLGSNFNLRLFAQDGTQKWQVTAPAVAWAVNISGDGKLAVAALGDGTIRWYRMTDGQELLAFFPHADQKRWALWTPSGYYDCSPGAEDLIGWHVNHGRDQAADFFPVSRFRDAYYRPDVVSKILTTQDEAEALSQANAEAGRKAPAADIQTSLPPVVAITAPENNAGVTTDHLALRYLLRTPSGEPVTEVRALVDGRPAQTESGLSVVSAAGVTHALNVPLPPRDCLVSVLAFNKFGASEPASLHVHWAGTAQVTDKGTEAVPTRGDVRADFTIPPKLYLLAVGISRYQDTSLTLNYSAKDAGDFVQAMRAQKGKLYRDVVVYGDKALTDKDATREAIEDGLDWLQKQATSNDVAMIFLSGHGSNDANGKYFFLPANFDRDKIKRTGLPWTDIVSTVQDIAGKVILFNDSCHSGNVLGGGLKGLPDNTGAINELISAENGAVVFAASTGSEYAREDPAWNNGAFTKALVEGLGGSADYGHTGRITINMLSLYVAENVKKLTGGTQHPTCNKPPTVRDFPVALDEGK